MNIKRIQIIQGKGELNSSAGNYLSGLVLSKMARSVLPKNFHTRTSYAIVDRDILLTQIVLLCGMVAFNVLRSIGQEVVALAEYAQKKIKVTRWRLKTVLQEVIYSACRIVSHAGCFFLNFGSHCPWFDVYSRLPQALD